MLLISLCGLEILQYHIALRVSTPRFVHAVYIFSIFQVLVFEISMFAFCVTINPHATVKHSTVGAGCQAVNLPLSH